MDLSTVLISGASRGLGKALAREFLDRGSDVYSGMRTPDDQGHGIAIPLNVRDLDSVAAAVESIRAAGKQLDILVNNAAIHIGGALCDLEQDDFKHVLDVNLLGAWRLTKAAVPIMKPGGVIVMISSLSGLVGLPDDGAYAASKFALEGMSQSLAAELAPKGLRVVVIEPGAIKTDLVDPSRGDSAQDVARTVVDITMDSGATFRNLLGKTGEYIAEALGVDDGKRTEAIVKNVTGKDWQPQSV